MPAVLYGPKISNIVLSIEVKEFEKVYAEAGESSVIKLEIQEGDKKSGSISKGVPVLIKEVVLNPVTDSPIHVDFYSPKLGEKVEATVSLTFDGVAPAVKTSGGVLIENISELEVKALPKDLPSEIKVDISGLKEINDSVLVRDIIVPADVEILKSLNDVIVTIAPPRKAEEEKPEQIVEEEETTKVKTDKGPSPEEKAGE